MTPKEFIISNSAKFAEAVENGYDIRMDEEEIFEWMERYRTAKLYYYLKKGEIVQDGDEVEMSAKFRPPKWVKASAHSIGTPAPDPQFMAHRVYRRLITAQHQKA